MTVRAIAIEAEGIRLRLDPTFGMVEELAVSRGGRTVSMLHKAPWHGRADALPASAAPHLKRLAGDFFCAPFGNAEADGAPPHGWPANSSWAHRGTERQGNGTVARFELPRRAMGAKLTKELRLVDGHPFLYQRHIFEGGSGTIPVANHAMLSLPKGGRLSFSPKRWFENLPEPLETDPARGRSLLRYPAKSADARRFPRADGSMADLTSYPFGERHEDFCAGVEAQGSELGWTAVERGTEGDLFLSLRDPKKLPLTMLWFSNGGRDYAPWNGRHVSVLGVEEGVGRAVLGASAREEPHPLEAAGVPTGLTLGDGEVTEVRHVIGSVAWAGGRVAAVGPAEGGVRVTGADGRSEPLPCDLAFLSA
ncbi:MAG TPA: hypothetical protein VGN97_22125 [Mesorhizobium sp.]|jgi:hypothetical protein|nr:hypothetical protein [Mesorhizobium sp.]